MKAMQVHWLGHSTVLLRIGGLNVITDPVFSNRIGLYFGLGNIGPKRLTAPALHVKDLPPIDLILLSHAHMDHFDIPTLRRLESPQTTVVTAMNTSDLLRVGRYQAVHELGWHERIQIGPLRIEAVQVRHWGARMISDRHRGYNGYVIENQDSSKERILFGGDTAYTTEFRNVQADLAIMPIGAYNPWIHAHCSPEQAWKMAGDTGAELFLPIHHQTFALGRESFYEPIERFVQAAGNSRSQIIAHEVGDRFDLAA
jgi:L-ascorbate metabolism protein UlaG (beta-lactamase superfamily)